jgi:hypothetical protein
LILAGETPPRRSGSGVAQLAGDVQASGADESDSADGQRVTFISARVDAVVTQGMYTPMQQTQAAGSSASGVDNLGIISRGTQAATISRSYSSMPALPNELYQGYVVSNGGSSSYGADAYARTRDLTDRTVLIDTYA